MTEKTQPDGGAAAAPQVGPATDIDAADLDVQESEEKPASSDPEQMADDASLGGTQGGNAGGAG